MGNLKSAEGQRMQSGDKTFGVSTLKREHIKIKPNSVRIQFKGKKGVEHDIEIKSKKLQDQIKAVYNSGYGKTLLNVSPKQLADYIKKELKVNPKDLRTLRANIIAEQESKRISKRPKPRNKSEANKELDAIANKVAEVLGNTKGVARRSYIDADILDSHRANRLKKAEIFELIEDTSRDLMNFDLEFRIQELESKFSKDLSEATFNELKELKKNQNIN